MLLIYKKTHNSSWDLEKCFSKKFKNSDLSN